MEVIAKETPQVEVAEAPKDDPTTTNHDNFTDNHRLYLLRFFDVQEPVGSKTLEQFRVIDDYLRENSTTDAEYLNQLKQLRLRLGSPKLGQTMWGRMNHYLKLLNQRKSIDREISDHETSYSFRG